MLLPLRLPLPGRAIAAVGRSNRLDTTRLVHQHSANMSSETKPQKSAKFGHLPLSTSGPQKTTLTARFRYLHRHRMLIPHRVMRSCEHPTSTRAQPSPETSATRSSSMASSPRTSRRSTSRCSAPTPSTARARTTSPRTPS
jgi:hypothetical protein